MELHDLLTALNLSDFIVIDLETTGLDADKDRITELGAVRFSAGEPVEHYQQLVNPGMPIPRVVEELTHISDAMVAGEPREEEVLDDYLDFLGDFPLVAHNADFDIGFLNVLLKRHERAGQINNPVYDTFPLSRTFLYHRPGYSLGDLCRYFEVEHTNAHRAYQDALATGHLFLNLIAEAAAYPLPIIQRLLTVQTHVDMPNRLLYQGLADHMSGTGSVTGLMPGRVTFTPPQAIFEHHARAETFQAVSPADFFSDGGVLSKSWDDYESRAVQVEFAESVARTLSDGHILLAEAGTGLGKSMGYLLPAINHALSTGETVVVACHTKHLQDQLFFNEIPRVAEYLDAPLQAVMLKGRGNYLCQTRLETVLGNAERLLNRNDVEAILPIIIWEQFTKTGDIDECAGFSAHRAPRLWAMLRSERGFCLGNSCSRYNGCFMTPIRNAARKAQLLVVNHALLLADAAGSIGVLPEDYLLILDEAHNIPRVAQDQSTVVFSERQVRNLVDNYGRARYRQLYRNRLKESLNLIDQTTDYETIRSAAAQVRKTVGELFQEYVAVNQLQMPAAGQYFTQTGRYVDPGREFQGLEEFTQQVHHSLELLHDALKGARDALAESEIAGISSTQNELESDLSDAAGLLRAFEQVALDPPDQLTVLWREVNWRNAKPGITFFAAPLLVAPYLRRWIFDDRPARILCSATLQAGGGFDFFKGEVGLDESFDSVPVHEREFPSPFFYEEQCAIFAWDGPVEVTQPGYPAALADLVDELSDMIPRRMLVLFTSYAQLRAVHEGLYHRLHRSERELLTQFPGTSRRSLLESFKQHPRAILLGTASFWEGIDLPGEYLQIVIIARLPFASPADPILDARVEYLRDQDRNPFMEYQVPDAITRFRQGFGRLIRTSRDEGLFIIADSRVTRRRYGELFLDALPVEAIKFRRTDQIMEQAKVVLSLK